MAIFKIGSKGKQKQEIDSRVRFLVDKNLNANQKSKGIVAKVIVMHPAFTVNTTVWKHKTKDDLYVTPPQLKTNDNSPWAPLVLLTREVRDHILSLITSEDKPMAPYLVNIGEYEVTETLENESLGIINVIVDSDVTMAQDKVGILCKMTIETTIGTLINMTVFESQQYEGVYCAPPKIDGNMYGYRLSETAESHLSNVLHANVDWSVKREFAPRKERVAPVEEEIVSNNKPVTNSFVPDTNEEFDEEKLFEEVNSGV